MIMRQQNEECSPQPEVVLCSAYFFSPSIAQKHSQIPHGLVEHKARPILDPALYSERYIKQDPALLPKTGGWVCRHHLSCCYGGKLNHILDQMFHPASAVCLLSLDGGQMGVTKSGGRGVGTF